jgi:hypothetical protein
MLFVDVSWFTSLAERLDPEELHWLMRRAFDWTTRRSAMTTNVAAPLP